METQPTCGKGLAENSVLPAKLGELTAAMAELLEAHMTALDLTDANSRKEHDAYAELAKRQREIANQLKATAGRMAGYRDLPMGRHEQQLMSGPKVGEAFAKFVQLERELLAMLQHRLERDQKMLRQMGEFGDER